MNFKLRQGWLIVLCFSLEYKVSFSQHQADEVVERIIESIAQDLSEDHDYTELTERLNFYRKNPININQASRVELQELLFISPLQINTLLLHRTENGLFLDLLELQSLSGFDPELIRLMLHFVKLEPGSPFTDLSIKKLISKGSHDLMMRFGRILEQQEGFSTSGKVNEPEYLGSPMRIFMRYRYNYANKISASLNMEKDAGEPFFAGMANKGFDFYSANISIKGNGLVRKFVLGDYALQFGQGLTMWSGLGFGKGAILNTMAKQNIGLRPYSSANEALFLRGLAGTMNYNRFSLTPFFSGKKVDLSLSDSQREINSLGLSGLHRTRSELMNKHSAFQLVYGLNSQFNNKSLNIGLTAYHIQFSLPFAAGNSLYQQFNFTGKSLTNMGIHYSYTFKNTYVFGEAAHSLNSGFAGISGLMSSLTPQVSLVLLYRNYGKDYHSFFNQSVSESTNAQNEIGFYSGLSIKFSRKWEILAYSDFFRFPWLKFRVDAPSKGYEIFAQCSYAPNKKFKLICRFKQQVKEENSDELNYTAALEAIEKQNYRLEINYKVNDSFSLRNRAEILQYNKFSAKAEFGFLTYQDIIYDPLSSKFSWNIRFGIFDTAGFNSRIYAYENDVLYSYSVPGYQGSGLRFYINGRYTIKRGLDIWLRYALLSYADQEIVGTGNDMIRGNHRSDIKFQLRYQF